MRHALPLAASLLLGLAAPSLVAAQPKGPPPSLPQKPPTPPDAPPAPPGPPVEQAQPREELLLGEWPPNEPTVTMELENERTRDALGELAGQAGWSLVFEDRVRGRVDATFRDLPADQALLAILRTQGLVATRKGNLVTISVSARPQDDEDEHEHDETSAPASGHPDRTVFGRTLRVGPGETVGSAVAIGGSVEIDGTCDEAVSVGGSVRAGPNARILGDAVSVGGRLDIHPDAYVKGDRVGVGSGVGIPSIRPGIAPDHGLSWHTTALDVALSFLRFAVLFVLGLLLLLFLPERVAVAEGQMRRAPAASLGMGFLALVGLVPLVVVLVVSVVGILALPVLALVAAATVIMGLTVVANAMGQRLGERFRWDSQALRLALGIGLFFLVSLVPWLGGLALLGMAALGIGSVLLSRFGTPPRAPTMPPVPPPAT